MSGPVSSLAIVVVILLVVVGVGWLLDAAGGLFDKLLPSIVVVGAGLYVLVQFLIALSGDVFSWRGLTWSFGLAGAEGLHFPLAVRVVTITAIVEIGVFVSMALDWQEGRRLGAGLRRRWLLGHVGLLRRVLSRLGRLVLAAWRLLRDVWADRGEGFLEWLAGLRSVIPGRLAWRLRDELAQYWTTLARRVMTVWLRVGTSGYVPGGNPRASLDDDGRKPHEVAG